MQIKIETRIKELQQELESGQTTLKELDLRSIEIKSQMLRINGAIQILNELLAECEVEDAIDPTLKTVSQ